jgi:hypothetical protein
MIVAWPSVLGVALGMRHALEPDHLAAVSTLTSQQKSAKAGLVLGMFWGLGHTLSLFVVGGTLAVLETHLPPRLESGFEVLVSLMISFLGVRALQQALREGREGKVHSHAHGGLAHSHPAPEAHLHVSKATLATRPLLIGLVHGLAGSGALTVIVLTELHSTAERLTYILLFGGGSIFGMGLLTGLVGVPLSRAARNPRLATGLLVFTGVVSLIIGAWWGVTSASRLFDLA